ncbi:death-associated inhibitor of apoptosis 2 [Musca vetustissima]|uniref:death-associated inhibitor of apoptosis 2 n=1 Tax=Musca vetustissima TaxID=27455 RepID=UPI002AB6D585|nr:death-associated inhibitor of apoptosis 2 [Musca vetustissima]
MNSEEERLRTFSTWPVNAPVYPNALAKNGFFATGNFLEASCHWCNCRISDWEYGDEVQQRHLAASPQCDFITNYANCGNVRIQEMPHSTSDIDNASALITPDTQQSSDLMIEANRLATFKNWPNPNISPESLAKAGFFYLNRSDQVMCAWCKGVIAQWEKQDNAFQEHRRFFPGCPRAQLGPLIEIASAGIRDLGIQQISPAKNPKYSSLDARLRTYTNWPIPDIQKPESLAQAGLYYQGVDDQVRCFHCNMGLRSWEKEDDPWFEHAKWYPMCQFVRLVKGAKYIEDVQEMTRRSNPTENLITPIMTIDEAMLTPPVRLALEMGVDGGVIRNETLRQLNHTGRPYETVEDLLKAVFDGNENSDEQNIQSIETSCRGECTGIINSSAQPIESNNAEQFESNSTSSVSTATNNIGDGRKAVGPNSESKSNECVRSASPTSRGKEQSATELLSLEEENRKLKDARLCKICLDEEVAVVYLPCGHLVSCVQCAPGVEQCPLCRTAIKGFVRTYLS